MTIQTKAILKGYFETGDIPTEAHFADLIDSTLQGYGGLLVAASDAPQAWIDHADYACDGTDDQVQIQAAIDALPSLGGKVRLSPGTFMLAWAGQIVEAGVTTVPYCVKVLDTVGPITIQGVPGATTLKLTDTQPANTVMLAIHGMEASNRTSSTRITGIAFDGNKANQPAWNNLADVSIMYAVETTVDHCRFENWKWNGIHNFRLGQKTTITNNYFLGPAPIRMENNYFIITNNIFEDDTTGTYAGVQLVPDSDVSGYYHRSSIVANNQFLGGAYQLWMGSCAGVVVANNNFSNQALASGYCIYMIGTLPNTLHAHNNIIVGNTFWNFAKGILLTEDGTGQYGCYDNIVAFNNFDEGPDRAATVAIKTSTGITQGNLIAYNHIDAGITAAIESDTTKNTIVGNIGWITENKGAAATVADGGTIAHGCAAAPTMVQVSGTVAGEIVTVTSIDATNITVAIKDNDGSAGTTQTIYWRAEV